MKYVLEILPLLLLFVIFFMAFSFIETVILLAIKHYLRKYWVLFVDKLMRGVTFHKNLVRILAVGSLALLVGFMVLLTPVFDILVEGDNVIQFLGIVLIIEMVIIYLVSHREVAETIIEKRIHLYVFTFFSITAYTAIMLMANRSYADYEQTVNKSFIYPIIKTIERNYEERVEDLLMEITRNKVEAGECPYYDYADNQVTGGITQFFLMKDDPALREEGAPEEVNAEKPLAGKRCVFKTTFLLTPQGKWYQVIETGS